MTRKKALELQGKFSIVWKQNKNKWKTYQKQSEHKTEKQKHKTWKKNKSNRTKTKTAKNESKLLLQKGMLGMFVSKKLANIEKGQVKKER